MAASVAVPPEPEIMSTFPEPLRLLSSEMLA
jgi:hypothetical protein